MWISIERHELHGYSDCQLHADYCSSESLRLSGSVNDQPLRSDVPAMAVQRDESADGTGNAGVCGSRLIDSIRNREHEVIWYAVP